MKKLFSGIRPAWSYRSKGVGFAILFCSIAAVAQSADTKIVVGTGGKAGVYYRVGEALCRFVNSARSDIKCKARSTMGARENFPKIRQGKFDFIVARSDWARDALHGAAVFASVGPDENLRSVFSLYGEPATLIARQDAGITSPGNWAGKRIEPGWVSRSFFETLLKLHGVPKDEFPTGKSVKPGHWGKALCGGEIDALLLVGASPSGLIQKIAKRCPVTLVRLSGKRVNRLVKGASELSKTTIPGGIYQGVGSSTESFGYSASVLSRADVPEQVVYDFVKATFQNIEKMRSQNPVWHDLHPSKMIRDGIVAPLHPGAIRYYRERGWLK
ncbi:MAG: TAXI family TRAP transporter solute-binding subunit [Rhodobacteraceae bacterium]|nr:TAXI family TRAP transporter solute-binding subunit [Paracoccaceae bacterium]